MTIAVRGVVELFRLAKREKEVDRQITAFSVSHDHRTVRIYGHYKLLSSSKARVLPSCEGAGKAAVPEHPALPDPSKSTSKLKAPVLHEIVGETTRTTVFKGKRYGTVTAVKIARRPTTEATARSGRTSLRS
ncbi:hypothetical protein K469DRAFT_561658 [Zopfia rhizophila CBS 207.26]|uniref:DUF7924 domain-containing protein n=1 Tax=Zopfia rhizophila CBS 207.26 TaxID=1314779 RepID=A0A6A6EFV4_9PEZI|nr:hypothetical protein K469DRAFT_561658 [Zopfia rhizophila CBS 207.26]